MKNYIKYPMIVAVLLGTGGLLFALLSAHAMASTQAIAPAKPAKTSAIPMAAIVPVVAVAPVAPTVMPMNGNAGVLDARRQFALGMIESGNKDSAVGGAGEVSRYQIMPAVWHQYSDSSAYYDQATSLSVARQHWTALCADFKRQAHREPTDSEMYVLWNTHYGYYANHGFDFSRLNATIRDRAERYANLVGCGPS